MATLHASSAPTRPLRATPATAAALATLILGSLGVPGVVDAQQRTPGSQPQDLRYTEQIRAFTTEPFFLTPLVDHLPASETIPTPFDVLGYIAGTPEVLTHTEGVYRYLRAVAEASDRVTVKTIGVSEEGRDILLVLISDEATIAEVDRHQALMARLADPRKTSQAEAAEIIATVKPMYWATGAIHSAETGSPEMLMELVYRLAVDEGEFIRAIRDNLIVMITPVVEADGRDKQVDVHMGPRLNPDVPNPNRTLYWGKYVYHSNNRDGMQVNLALSRAIVGTYLDYHPLVVHDLHESASYLYTSTGRGPYNAWIDPMVISEWNRLAHREVRDMGAFGVPGVYTHDFYDGWTPNYMFWVAHIHNSIGRFYETQAARDASNYILNTSVDREWHRPNTPLRQVVWSIRNNVNLQQSALLIALNEVATNREEYLRNFWIKSERSIAKARVEGPAAYVFPADDPRPGQQARTLQTLERHGIEVHRTTAPGTVGNRTVPAGSYVVRMDQPYSRGADMLLDRQYYSPDDPRPYDDVGWTFGPLYNAVTERVDDVAVLDIPMTQIEGGVRAVGTVVESDGATTRGYLIRYNADNNLTAFIFARPNLRVEALREGLEVDGYTFGPGSFFVPVTGNDRNLARILQESAETFGFEAIAVDAEPAVARHPVARPRIAVVHTWLTTQNEGWLRLGLDEYGVPYDYVSVHTIRDTPNLRARWDVLIMGPSVNDPLQIVRGVQGPSPIPWQAAPHTPHIGRQASSPDIRGGLELEGVLHLKRFVEGGGTLVTLTNSSSLPMHFDLAAGASLRTTSDLWAPGGVFRVDRADATSPITWGYDESLGVYFNSGPIFQDGRNRPVVRPPAPPVTGTTARRSGRGGLDERDVVQAQGRDWGQDGVAAFRAEPGQDGAMAGGGFGGTLGGGPASSQTLRTLFRFSSDPAQLLISGGLDGAEELAGSPALLDARVGNGHVVMFSFNPFWRGGTLGSYALLFNALLHHGHLSLDGTAGAGGSTTR
jgi:hypothetical protein